jgi:nicotinamidase-related amidase
MEALLVVDMQTGILQGDPKYNLSAVISRIKHLAARVRREGGRVFFIQHDGAPGDTFAPNEPGWHILDALAPEPGDCFVRKSLNSAFVGTSLEADLAELEPQRVLVTGWATDMCVDATVRSAAEREFRVVVIADSHTVSNRPHLRAQEVIEHHHWIWANLFAEHAVRLANAADF